MINFTPIQKMVNPLPKQPVLKSENILLIRTANECIEDAKTKPIPQMLFSEFWHEGEICILFADSNLGKSILAVLIADSISNGKSMRGFRMEAKKQKVLYFDFEMSDKQFEKRYSNNYTNHYRFDDNFHRVNINPNCTDFTDFENQLFIEIENTILQHETQVLIIDNLTYLKTQSTDTSKEALPLMKKLKELAIKYELSILALAHTPKRSHLNPITMNDLAGSKQLSNFADSIFAIGPSSKDKTLRYIKQIKARATEIVYDSDNVFICEINKLSNLLEFEFVEFGIEQNHLRVLENGEQESIDQTILDMKQVNPSISNYEIAKRLDTNKMKVKRVLNKHNQNNGNR